MTTSTTARLWRVLRDALRGSDRSRDRTATEKAPPDPRLLAARAAGKAGDWVGAAELYEQVVADGSPLKVRYRLGEVYHRLGREADARATIAAALSEDPRHRPVDDELLARRVTWFRQRRRAAHFVQDNLDRIRAAAEPDIRSGGSPRSDPDNPSDRRRPHIFIYWAQGMDAAPPVVRLCHEQLLALHGPQVVVALDDGNLAEWIELPDLVIDRAHPTLTQYSDVVRCALLAAHGGVWVDATVLVTEDLIAAYPVMTRSGFYALSYQDGHPASWFLASEPGGRIVTMLREAQYLYWQTHRRATGYFMVHQLFEALRLLDPEFEAAWLASADQRIPPDRSLQRALLDPYDADRLDALLSVAVAHKLTYKKAGADRSGGTMLAHLIEHGVPTGPA